MILYNSQVSGNCYKVRLLLAQLGIPYERRELSVVDRSNRAELVRYPAVQAWLGRVAAQPGHVTIDA